MANGVFDETRGLGFCREQIDERAIVVSARRDRRAERLPATPNAVDVLLYERNCRAYGFRRTSVVFSGQCVARTPRGFFTPPWGTFYNARRSGEIAKNIRVTKRQYPVSYFSTINTPTYYPRRFCAKAHYCSGRNRVTAGWTSSLNVNPPTR